MTFGTNSPTYVLTSWLSRQDKHTAYQRHTEPSAWSLTTRSFEIQMDYS